MSLNNSEYKLELISVITPEEKAYISPFEKMCAQVAREAPITFLSDAELKEVGFHATVEEVNKRYEYPILFDFWKRYHPEDYED